MKYVITVIKYIIKIISVLVVLSLIGLTIHGITTSTFTPIAWEDISKAFLIIIGVLGSIYACLWAWDLGDKK